MNSDFTNNNVNSTILHTQQENQNLNLTNFEINYTELYELYKNQIEQMHEFGFTNDEENIRALFVITYIFIN